MAISDLVHFNSQQSSSKVSPVTDCKPPSLVRFEFIVKRMAENAIKGPGAQAHHKQMMRIVSMIFDEAVQELVENKVEDDMMSSWIYWFGKLFEWCANGETDGLPDDMKEIIGHMEESAPALNAVKPA